MKTYKNEAARLDQMIDELELQRKIEFNALKSKLDDVVDGFKPMNLLTQALVDIRETPDIRRNLLESVVSIAGGYFSKRLLIGNSGSIFKRIIGNVLQFGVTNFISKKIDNKVL